ncbi:MAG: L-lactate permease [Paludibacter sp.]|nr:L-lactate permease [Paludibacter sp.]
MDIVFPDLLLAVTPVVLLVFLLGFLRMSGDKSALITLGVTIVLVVFFFKYPLTDTGLTLAYGVLKAFFPILTIILMAVFSYNVLVHTGSMEVIKSQFISVSSDKCVQVLLITWGLGGLLEGMAGFGTAVAIPAAILISLGFKPLFSALVSLIANSVATTFGAVGTPVVLLARESGVADLQQLSVNIIWQLAVLMFLVPLVLVILTDPKIKKLPEHIFLGLLIGGVSFGSQLIAASYLGAETPAIIGSICSIFVTVAYGKITSLRQEKVKEKIPLSSGSVVAAWSVYGLILVFIILTSPLFQLKEWLGDISVTVPFRLYDAVIQDYHIKSIKIAFLTDTWMLLFAGTLIGGLVQGAKLKIIFRILWDTVKQLKKTMVTVSSLIVMSSLLDHSGMIFQIGTALVVLTGTFYPLFAPLVGFLGTFLTGSDTSSNILFGKLQANVAQQLGVNGVTGGAADPAWLAAANSAGATGGKIISPQSIAVATSACDQQGREGEILKKALPYALVYVLICGLSVYFFK